MGASSVVDRQSSASFQNGNPELAETLAVGVDAFLKQNEEKELLRFSTAGSVDDGKSTLIGRLLYDARGVYEDQLAAVKNSPINRALGPIDFSLLTDGLRAEREQGITIDVAYRYFTTSRRKFIIADTPGHVQYTRNMATGASTADLAIVLIDARHGVLPQSKRHAYIAWLLGIPQLVVAVNKMDLTGYDQGVFRRIREEFSAYLKQLGITGATFIPVSALEGDNVVHRSAKMPWYEQDSLLEHLETTPLAHRHPAASLRFPVQYVVRPDLDFRGYAGQVASGVIRPGDTVMVLPSGRTSRVKSLPSFEGDLAEAFAPMPATVCLEDELDISRGDMLVNPQHLPHVSRNFQAKLVWMNEQPLRLNQPYLLKHTTQQAPASVTVLHYKVDVETLEQISSGPAAPRGAPGASDASGSMDEVRMNEIAAVSIESSRPLYFDGYRTNRSTGSFILIDPISNATLAAGMIEEKTAAETEADRRLRSSLLKVEATRLTQAERHARAGHYPATIWLTARENLAYVLERKLFERGCQVHVLADSGDSRILPELAQLLNSAGLISIFSAPVFDGEERERARALAGERHFLDIAPENVSPDDERAAEEICARLESDGVIRSSKLGTGEGI
jgi:sulfate adenylyltransferase large subunit